MTILECFRNLSWMQGDTICKELGGHLPFINSENDANSLTLTLNEYTESMFFGILRDWREILSGDVIFLGLLRDKVNFIFVIENMDTLCDRYSMAICIYICYHYECKALHH